MSDLQRVLVALAEDLERVTAGVRELADLLDQPAPVVTAPAPAPAARFGDRIWFGSGQAATYAGSHPVTVRKALEAGALHGTQRVVGGRWRIHVDCLDGWLSGSGCPHQ